MKKNLSIRNLIFDLGGVILDIEYNRSIEAFRKLGFDGVNKEVDSYVRTGLFVEYETGRISTAQFRERIRALMLANQSVSDSEIDSAWNAMILDIPPIRIELLKKLRKQYRLFLLSNTNELHYQCYTSILQKRCGVNSLDDLFDRTYYSHQLGMAKPSPEIYQHVLTDSRLTASETMFIDDFQKNTLAAESVGIQGYWLTDGVTILDLFAESQPGI